MGPVGSVPARGGGAHRGPSQIKGLQTWLWAREDPGGGWPKGPEPTLNEPMAVEKGRAVGSAAGPQGAPASAPPTG